MAASPTKAAPSRERRKTWLYVGSLVAFVLMAAGVHFQPALGAPGMVAAIVGAAFALGLGVAAFAALDEVAQRAHYVAWFWGGSLGLALLPMAILIGLASGALRGGGLDALTQELWGTATTMTGFLTGVLVSVIPPAIGYGLWWLVFWLRRR